MSLVQRDTPGARSRHVEVSRITFDGSRMVLALETPGRVDARRRGDGTVVRGRRGSIDLATLGDGTWDLRSRGARLARHADGIRRKHAVVSLPGVGPAQPFFTVRNGLSVRVGDRRDEPGEPGANRRSRYGGLAVTVHRAAMALLVPLLRRRRPVEAEPRVRVLLLHAYGMGGTIRTTLNLAEGLALHHHVELVSLVRHRPQPFFALPERVAVRDLVDARPEERRGARSHLLARLPSLLVHPDDTAYPRCSLQTDLALVRALRGWQGTLVTTRPAFNLLAARLAGPGLRVVAQEHMNSRAHHPRLMRDCRRHYPRLAALTVLTEDDRADYDGLVPLVERIPNATTPARGTASLDTKVVMAAGRLTVQKGFDRLIPAFAFVAREHPDWQLRILGSGPERPALEKLIAEHGLHDQVFLMGRARDIGKHLMGASVFALPSRYEGFGIVLIEAMSHGIPVVSYDCPRGPSEIVTPGVDGFLVPEGDVPALGRALLTLVEDDELRRSFGAAALASSGRYGLDAFAERWEGLLGRL